MPIFELGDFKLLNGVTLPNALLGYETHGTLNAAKDNAIVFPNFLGGTPAALEMWIGEGRPLDPRKYFIILPGLFGAGVSSSPSNTPPPFGRASFPDVQIADDAIAQQRLLSERLWGPTDSSHPRLVGRRFATLRMVRAVSGNDPAHGGDCRRTQALRMDAAVVAHGLQGSDHFRRELEPGSICQCTGRAGRITPSGSLHGVDAAAEAVVYG